jgi:hypothetical protein
MDASIVIFSGITAFAVVIVINGAKEFIRSRLKNRLVRRCEYIELQLFRFPVDTDNISELLRSTGNRRGMLEVVEAQKQLLILAEQMINDIPCLDNKSPGYLHLNKLLLKAKQRMKNLEEQLESRNK